MNEHTIYMTYFLEFGSTVTLSCFTQCLISSVRWHTKM